MRVVVRASAWQYVDERRRHEVRAFVQGGARPRFVVRETGAGSEEVYEVSHRLLDAWESVAHRAALEDRLARLGRYHRRTLGEEGWVALPPKERLVVETAEADGGGRFAHYEGRDGVHAVTLVALARGDGLGGTLLARLDYAPDDPEGGNLRILHASLPRPLYDSVLAAQHLELANLGFRPVGRGVMDARGWAALKGVVDAILVGALEHATAGEVPGAPRQRATVADVAAALTAIRTARGAFASARKYEVEDEIGPDAAPVEAKKPTVMIEDISASILAVLDEPRVRALHARYLPPAEDARLLAEGRIAILAAVKRLRVGARGEEQHLLSILEASLLVRSALSKRGVRVDPGSLEVLRHAAAYL